jgi:phosphoenolpyruvate-protein phosphotransferase
MPEKGAMRKFKGKMISPGLGKGKVFVYRDIMTRFDEFYDIEDLQVEEEIKRYGKAVERVADDLNALVVKVEKEMDSNLSAIFEAHVYMLKDANLKAEVEKEIAKELVSAGTAVRAVFRRWERRFRSMETEMARQKGDDIRDLTRRLLSSLAGIRAHSLEMLEEGCILVANRLLPSDTIFLDRQNASAAVVEFGGAGSHAALFANQIGLPAVAGIPGIVEMVSSEAPALVDAETAEVIINPTDEQQADFEEKRAFQKRTKQNAQASSHEPAITKDGKRIAVYANVGCVDDTREAMDNGAEGVGLYRIEHLYLGRQTPPDADSLVNEMRKTLAPAKGLPVCVRLLDVGADKPLPFMETIRELNPSLGRRGIRFLLKYPNLLRTQLQAIFRLSTDFDLLILVPMVTLPDDVRIVKELMTEIQSWTPAAPEPRLGAMIETPAAALSAPDITRYVEFLSFGTNDLTQYTFAADRENGAVDAYFDDTHEVIFNLMRTVHNKVPHIPLSVCGELASRPRYVSKLLDCGIRSLSVASPLIPMIKQAVRQSGQCQSTP